MGGQFEVKDGATKKYYSIAGMMVAVHDGTGLQYLLTDHLGSTVAVTNQSGTLTSQQRYLPFGAERTIPNSPILGTDFTYTGQRKLDDGMGGIMDYKARFYSVGLGRFLQPDSIIPNPANPQSMNRFGYVLNNPIRFSDPTGHKEYDEAGGGIPCYPGELTCQLQKDGYKPKAREEVVEDLFLITPPTFQQDQSATTSPTVMDRAFDGDIRAMLDVIIPTHFGFRLQGEFSIPTGTPWGPSGALGVNWIHNFRSGENDSNADFTLEPYSGGFGGEISFSGGVLFGWGSSNVKDVTAGKAEVFGGTVAAGPAVSVSVVAPMHDNGTMLHVDPAYGMVPTTLYIGGGSGCCYAGGGAGKSITIFDR